MMRIIIDKRGIGRVWFYVIVGLAVLLVFIAVYSPKEKGYISSDLSDKSNVDSELLKKNITHLECVNFACAIVNGPGSNQCNSTLDCLPQQHYACISNNSCGLVNGSGPDLCNNNIDCIGNDTGGDNNNTNTTHLSCVNYTCTLVNGTGTNECSNVGSSCNGSGGGNQTNFSDLIVQSISTIVNQSTNSTYEVTIVARIINIGGSYAGSNTAKFYVTPTGGQQFEFIPALNPGDFVDIFSLYNNLSAGNYSVTTNADWYNVINESNENNNFLNFKFDVP